ncbi:hypothetical protein PROFUN_00642 [Planoprotostelium fungivorum]|uniref:Uncharacterized protein n=1 Tax=Planoprotostelium fungivorum TaxID=1890364 RepID=A0A2P6NU04_9EUKA|nr:hypothetical protein PROFUN_00642 [Planoprotostelium fungivorum]
MSMQHWAKDSAHRGARTPDHTYVPEVVDFGHLKPSLKPPSTSAHHLFRKQKRRSHTRSQPPTWPRTCATAHELLIDMTAILSQTQHTTGWLPKGGSWERSCGYLILFVALCVIAGAVTSSILLQRQDVSRFTDEADGVFPSLVLSSDRLTFEIQTQHTVRITSDSPAKILMFSATSGNWTVKKKNTIEAMMFSSLAGNTLHLCTFGTTLLISSADVSPVSANITVRTEDWKSQTVNNSSNCDYDRVMRKHHLFSVAVAGVGLLLFVIGLAFIFPRVKRGYEVISRE